MEIGVKQAKIDLSKLITAALNGEKVIITSRGKPLVRIVPEMPKPKDPKRGYGALLGILNLPEGWDSPKAEEEFENLFEVVREKKGLDRVTK